MPVSKTAECYNMDHENRGKCVIFNNENFDNDELVPRKGSTLDALRLEKTFTKLGFDVKIHNDFTHQQIIDEIEKLSKLDHTDNDCLCVFTLTHGMQRDLIWARDVIYQSERLWKPFIASKCTTLAGKPKMFFFQACRGDESDSSVQLAPRSLIQTETDASPAGPASYEIPTHADFLLAHSSVQGFLGWRDPEYGTWYINCLCDVMDEHGTTMDLLNMLTLTARKVATEYVSIHDNIYLNNKRQVPSVTTMLTRSVYFPPKSKDE
ncbi:caspase-1-like [Pogonomyrmex barbatus]|uniref:Caspase-1-like n=1 Tax=Pogonomyrmex barbatus TaxID=144034 RepID=A0A6I9XN83_9HYME|nr:caspase-1-like [Pogonomyrmex barbatus]